MAWESKKYRRWVARLPCAMWGGRGGHPHHPIDLGGGLRGTGMKVSDALIIPLSAEAHRHIHGKTATDGDKLAQFDWILRTIRLGRHGGKLDLRNLAIYPLISDMTDVTRRPWESPESFQCPRYAIWLAFVQQIGNMADKGDFVVR